MTAKEREKARATLTTKLAAERRARDGAWIGMKKEQALAAGWGKPDKTYRTRTASGTFEQWHYRNYPSTVKSYDFINGVLTAIQD